MMSDVESLRPNVRSSRVRCVDVFLVGSVALLFAAVGVLSVALFWRVKDVHEAPAESIRPSAQRGENATSQQNFAFLQADSHELKTGNMRWTTVSHGEGSSVGSLFRFNPAHHTIMATRDGHYFIYIDFKLRCTAESCGAGQFTVSIGTQLTCTFELPQWVGDTPVNRKCWGVAKLAKERLVTKMTVLTKLDRWTIDVAASGQGMYLVD